MKQGKKLEDENSCKIGQNPLKNLRFSYKVSRILYTKIDWSFDVSIIRWDVSWLTWLLTRINSDDEKNKFISESIFLDPNWLDHEIEWWLFQENNKWWIECSGNIFRSVLCSPGLGWTCTRPITHANKEHFSQLNIMHGINHFLLRSLTRSH